MPQLPKITTVRHPNYYSNLPDWDLWRAVQEGGTQFVESYVKPLSQRETAYDFAQRKFMTPTQSFAQTAVVDIKNAVFQRMGDIVRRGGSTVYQSAVQGFKGGVNRRGSSMNNFIGTEVLPEMLFMGTVGVYVDNIAPPGPTLADGKAQPYLYTYPIEDIYSLKCSLPQSESDFEAVLLRDWCVEYDTIGFTGVALPAGRFERHRLVWIEDGEVVYQFYDAAGQPITATGEPMNTESPKGTGLKRIPFVLFDIGDSLLRNIAVDQIALTNLISTDINYARRSNFPFYTEQVDGRAIGGHLKSAAMEDGTSSAGGQAGADNEVKVGAMDGRTYGIGMDRPDFIHPSPEPIMVSMKLQDKIEDGIRKKVNLAVVSLGSSRASGEARAFDNQGLESGLAFIGMVLENGERKIADHWASYEGDDSRDTVVVKYPERYSLKSQEERLTEAEKLTKLMFSIPGQLVKKELAKDAVVALFSGRLDPDTLDKLLKQIDSVPYSTSAPDVIQMAKELGLAGDETLSDALGFNGKEEIKKAEDDHARRIARIQAAQTSLAAPPGQDPGARGIADLSTDSDAGKEEKEEASDTTQKADQKKPVRGPGKKPAGE